MFGRMITAILFIFICAPAPAQDQPAYIADARKAVEAFFAGFNAMDDAAVRKSLNYPHVRIASSNVRVFENAEAYSTPYDLLKQREGWHHSTLDKIEARQHDENKVHFEIVFSRYKEDGTKYVTHNSLWIVTNIDGHWGVQARSSFAP